MKEIEITKNNLEYFICNLRAQDKAELVYFLGNDYKKKFINFVLNNPEGIYFLSNNSKPSCIGGVYKDKIGAQVWLLCSDDYNKKYLLQYVR